MPDDPKANELRPPWSARCRPIRRRPGAAASEVPHPVGIYIGWAISHARQKTADGSVEEVTVLELGDDVQMTTVKSPNLSPETRRFVIVDYIKTEMSEYDSNYVFVPLNDLQRFRNLEGRVTEIQIRIKDYRDAKAVVERLKAMFNVYGLSVADVGGKAGPVARRDRRREGHPQRAAVHDHRRGRLRHPGHLLDDRRREDARHRHSQGAGRLQRRRDEDLPRLRPAARRRRRLPGHDDRRLRSRSTSTRSRSACRS